MFKLINLLTIFVTITFLCCGASACDEEEFQGRMRPTLNEKGDHFPNLGPTQGEFYKYCKDIDVNKKIQQPIVAIFGGAYGKRAIEVLQQTSRVTVVLNDLDARHFASMKQWCKSPPFDERLKLAPGSFLDIHKNKCVQDFFKSCPIKFHAILMANVFHYLHPLEGIQGLRYIADHLVEDGEVFLMTAQVWSPLKVYDASQIAPILCKLNEQFSLGLGKKCLEQASKIADARFEETYSPYVQRLQTHLLYKFNTARGLSFPGYHSREEGTLNPYFLQLSHFSFGDPQGKSFFTSAPEDMKRWSATVGLGFKAIKYLDINNNEPTVIIPKEHNPEEARYYFMRLKKVSVPDEGKYQELLLQAQCIDNELKKLHANKIFTLKSDSPYFQITDLKTKEKFSILDEKDEKQINDLSKRMFGGEIAVIVPLGLLYKKYELFDIARNLFQFADDMGIQEGKIQLNQ